MTTLQIALVAAAVVALVVLVVVRIASRRRATPGAGKPASEVQAPSASRSFLDEAPQDTLAGLGKVDTSEYVPTPESAAAPRPQRGRFGVASGEPHGSTAMSSGTETPLVTHSFLDEAPQDTLSGLGKMDDSRGAPVVDPSARDGGEAANIGRPHSAESADEAERAAAKADNRELSASPAPVAAEGAAEIAEFHEPESAPAPGMAREPGLEASTGSDDEDDSSSSEPPHREMVALSSIMVTTSSKMVDLADPDVRRMLTDLVALEIDQAVELRRQGLTVDAIMQLSEAEKISGALRLEDSSTKIRSMIDELRTLQ